MTEIKLRDETFYLLPERCALRAKDRTLLAADLHFGKAEVFQSHGIAISSRILDDDLARLSQAIEASEARRLLVIGDLIHAPSGLTPDVINTVSSWRAKHPRLAVQVIRGNHDRVELLPEKWRMELLDDALEEGPFCFEHEPSNKTGLHSWSGHLHPVVDIRGGGDRLRLPCFAIGRNQSILPAFSFFTGGIDFWRSRNLYRLFAIAENKVMEV